MEVKYINHMGSDLSVVNAARVSFGKRSVEECYDQIDVDGYQLTIPHINSKDRGLLRYLALHEHWTPFAHTALTYYIKAPIFVARQLGKHQVGLVWNEVSRRYVDYTPELYSPDEWRLASKDKKQGSSDETTEYSVQPAHVFALQCYQNMIETGIAPVWSFLNPPIRNGTGQEVCLHSIECMHNGLQRMHRKKLVMLPSKSERCVLSCFLLAGEILLKPESIYKE